MTRKAWFRPKSLGVGAVPVSWEGWAMTLGLLAYVGIVSLVIIEWPAVTGQALGPGRALVWGGLIILGVVIYMVVAWQRSSEAWYWRWDRDEPRQ